MSSEDSSGIIIVAVGLPGAGKSTLCRAFMKILENDNSITCRLVCYDEILNDRSCWDQPDFHWKMERRSLYDDIASWIDECIPSKRPIWLIIDDNMYYRSMRYPYFQLARQYRMAYTQIYVTCPCEIAMERNRHRPVTERVPDSVIERMSTRLQEPAPTAHTWEKCTIFMDYSDVTSLDSVLTQLRIASENPAPPLTVVDLEEKERQRQMTKMSLLHQADLMLRRIIGDYHKTDEKRYTSNVLMATKRRILENMRTGRLDLTVAADGNVDSMKTIFQDCADDLNGNLKSTP